MRWRENFSRKTARWCGGAKISKVVHVAGARTKKSGARPALTNTTVLYEVYITLHTSPGSDLFLLFFLLLFLLLLLILLLLLLLLHHHLLLFLLFLLLLFHLPSSSPTYFRIKFRYRGDICMCKKTLRCHCNQGVRLRGIIVTAESKKSQKW